MSSEVYLGDGLYASYPGGPNELELDKFARGQSVALYIELRAPRETGDHIVCLDPEVFEALIQYAINIGWLEKGQVIQ